MGIGVRTLAQRSSVAAFALMAGLCFVLPAPAPAAGAQLKTQVQAAYDRQCADIVKTDVEAWKQSMSDGFVLKHANGTSETRDELVASSKSIAGRVTFKRCYATLHEVKAAGGTVTVSATNGAEGTLRGDNGATLSFVALGESVDTWSTAGGRLVETASTELESTFTIDGKVVRHDRLGAASPSPAPPATVDPKVAALAKDWFHRLQKGNVDRSQLTVQANAQLTPALVQQVSAKLAPLGEPASFVFVASQTLGGSTVYEFLLAFPGGKLNEFLAIDANGKIAGLSLKPQ